MLWKVSFTDKGSKYMKCTLSSIFIVYICIIAQFFLSKSIKSGTSIAQSTENLAELLKAWKSEPFTDISISTNQCEKGYVEIPLDQNQDKNYKICAKRSSNDYLFMRSHYYQQAKECLPDTVSCSENFLCADEAKDCPLSQFKFDQFTQELETKSDNNNDFTSNYIEIESPIMHLNVIKESNCQEKNEDMQKQDYCQLDDQNWTVLSEDIDNQGSILVSLQIP